MSEEIKEIMNGNREIKHLRIEGETLGFDTQFHNNWNFTPRDIEQIIYTLQQENQQLKDENDKIKIAIIENCDLRLEVLKYKEVIEEVWNFIKSYPGISQSGVMTIKAILHKVKGE